MRQIRYHQKGAPEVMQIEDVPRPEPEAGELLVRIEAAGVAYGDVLRRSGRHYPIPTPLPHSPGGSVAGVVEGVGEGVDVDWVGKRVHGYVRTGGYAEYGAGAAATFAVLPDVISSIDAVAVIPDGITGSLILKRAGQLKPGDSVFVPAAAGGLGYLLLQLARLYGAGKVLAGASTPTKRELALADGADAAVDYTQEGWSKQVIALNGGEGVDLALETVGGPVFYETLEAVRAGGRVVNYGNASDTDSPVNPRVLLRRNLTLTGILAGPGAPGREAAREEVLSFMVEGKIKARARTYPLAEAAQAHRMIESRRSDGRLILLP